RPVPAPPPPLPLLPLFLPAGRPAAARTAVDAAPRTTVDDGPREAVEPPGRRMDRPRRAPLPSLDEPAPVHEPRLPVSVAEEAPPPASSAPPAPVPGRARPAPLVPGSPVPGPREEAVRETRLVTQATAPAPPLPHHVVERAAAAARPAAVEEDDGVTVVEVSIGRIEVSAPPPLPPRRAAPAGHRPMSLAEYLERRRGRGR
ncbi:MAG TPA: hypothetical protein VFR37_00960, partial [Longimicrobium sp.]|nr:hypothetical protein [Longimicrobium sp.]